MGTVEHFQGQAGAELKIPPQRTWHILASLDIYGMQERRLIVFSTVRTGQHAKEREW